jgi:16S rRNA (uracil1498-N3)-methyltransferase
MPRFFAEFDGQGRAVVTGRDAHHITGPLRRGVGDELAIRVGERGFAGKIAAVSPKAVTLEILSEQELHDRGQARVHLGVSLIDLKEMDLLIRSVTELGVSEIHPLVAERSNIRDIRGTRADRWRGIVLEAVKQCERKSIPPIHEPLPLKDLLENAAPSWGSRLVALASAGLPLSGIRAQEAGILIGPEGGFSPGETELILSAGFTPVHMGRTVLRAVTAAAAAMAILAG